MLRNRSHRSQYRLPIDPLEPRTLLSTTPTLDLFNASPALFVENQGQWSDPSIHYAFNGSAASIAFTPTGPLFRLATPEPTSLPSAPSSPHLLTPSSPHLPSSPLQFSMTFPHSTPTTPIPRNPSPSTFNYFLGDPSTWRSNVPAYQTLTYPNLYEGISLSTFGRRTGLKYEFHVAPHADYRQIQVSYTGIDALSIDDSGALHIYTPSGDLIEPAPFIYQTIAGHQVPIPGSYTLLDDTTYTFTLSSSYDPTHELIIDPDLTWSTYLGGSSDDESRAIAVDASGNVLVTGYTYSPYWTSGGYNSTYNGSWDVFVAKLSPSGGHLWSTYLGGIAHDKGHGIAVDSADNVLVTGNTASSTWSSGGYKGGAYDVFVTKLSPSGGRLWSTYLGGSGDDESYDIAVDTSGNVVVTGWTSSSGWTSGGFDTTHNGNYDAFVAKLSPAGAHLWSTYLGGEGGFGIAVDGSGDVLVTGFTTSSGWTDGGFDTSYNGSEDGFVVKLSASGVHLWSTYLGGSSTDDGWAIAVDGSGNVVVTGYTLSTDWTSGGFDTSYNGGWDAFVAKLSPSGSHLWSTYLGGSSTDRGYGITTDGLGNVLVTGYTLSTDWTSGGFDTSYNGSYDPFVAKLSSVGTHLWSTYLGGVNDDMAYAMTTDCSGNVLVTGTTWSSDWTSGGFDTSYNGGWDVFVVRIQDAISTTSLSDTIYLRLAPSAPEIQLFLSDSPSATPAYRFPLTRPEPLLLQALTGDDRLILDFSNGNPLPPSGLTFTGGDGNDSLLFTTTTTYDAFTNSTSTLDLADNPLLIHNATLPQVESWLRSQRLFSSSKIPHTTLAPFPQPNGSILVKLVYYGDTNHDGTVNLTDYFTIDSGYLNKRQGFTNGDANLDGEINLSDYFLIDSAYLNQPTPLAPSVASSLRRSVASPKQILKAPKKKPKIKPTFSSKKRIR